MTARDRFIIWGWIAVVVAAGIFPPWEQRGSPEGYYLLFSPPRYRGAIHVDQSRLMVEWIIVTAIAAGFRFAWPVRKAAKPVPTPMAQVGLIFEDDGETYMIHRIDSDFVYYHELLEDDSELSVPADYFPAMLKEIKLKNEFRPGTQI